MVYALEDSGLNFRAVEIDGIILEILEVIQWGPGVVNPKFPKHIPVIVVDFLLAAQFLSLSTESPEFLESPPTKHIDII